MSRFKNIIYIFAFILVVGLVGFMIYTFLFKPPQVTPEPTEEQPDQGVLPGSAEGGPVITPGEEAPGSEPGVLPPSQTAQGGVTFTQLLTTSDVAGTTVVGNNVAYYDPADGRFYSIDKNGNVVALSDTQFTSAQSVSIADTGNAAAIEFPDGSNIIYNFDTESQTSLPNHWEEFDFSPDASEVVTKSVGLDPNNRSLVITSADGSKTEVIASLGSNEDDVSVNWAPNGQIVGFSETGSVQSGFGRRQVFLIGLDGEEKGAIIVEGGNFSALWAPDGSNILYSVANAADNNFPSLWYTNASGDVGSERKKFPVATWVEKCTFYDAATIYCAVPREVPVESGIDHETVDAPDDVFAIDIRTGRSTLLATPAADMQMQNLFVSDDKTTLYFSDASGRLNSIKLR